MEQCSFWEVKSHSASQETHCLLWKPEVHYGVHKSRSGPYPDPEKSSPHLPILYPRSVI